MDGIKEDLTCGLGNCWILSDLCDVFDADIGKRYNGVEGGWAE